MHKNTAIRSENRGRRAGVSVSEGTVVTTPVLDRVDIMTGKCHTMTAFEWADRFGCDITWVINCARNLDERLKVVAPEKGREWSESAEDDKHSFMALWATRGI